ncbi:rhodanese-related sulfurtransferase/DNA-binding transcriptional ArsR family regulator [Lipingzhangella halophila]|uniref:Rhodanese-related sulfurtransferase/DNA-binding transcriptional ArsR family regulator n=1 Tax=Lipingzhangella halophila TaxID=1783352 RepID=A0A7W7RIY9_9ACTN|nr:metalloregulator ArsR/SmtB family transcription factor [Lipingzhangella halophila]MBB4932845.1 rhodanese-related sulfurtransferase/DNA-binding transcriptional ArsR family regulator [Lipingzhangella halophila]
MNSGTDVREAGRAELWGEFARVGKALGSPTRLQMLDLLAQGQRSVESLAQILGLGVSTTSAHLQTLKRAQLVRTHRVKNHVFYALAGDDVAALLSLVQRVAGTHLAEVERAWHHFAGPGQGEVEEVDRAELLARLDEGSALVLDVRPEAEFAAGHLPGAVSIPVDELTRRLDEVPEDADIVAYCRGDYCVMAVDAVRVLRSHGRRAYRLNEGLLEWRASGHPVHTASA